VPDAGSTLSLLGMALGALGFIRHRNLMAVLILFPQRRYGLAAVALL
jgi:hypothetical protein